jgi:hypothetical protein
MGTPQVDSKQEFRVTNRQLLRCVFGVGLAGGGFGLLSETARDTTGGVFRTVGMVAGAILLVAGLAVAGPVLKAFGQKKRDQ